MKNIVKIVEAHGGLEALKRDPIRIDPPSDGLMRLCIEYVGKGPRGQALVSIAHYFEQNGDLMSDPEVVVEVPDNDGWGYTRAWGPVSITMHSTAYHRDAVFLRDGKVMVNGFEVRDIKAFLPTWDRNIGHQGFLEAFHEQKKATAFTAVKALADSRGIEVRLLANGRYATANPRTGNRCQNVRAEDLVRCLTPLPLVTLVTPVPAEEVAMESLRKKTLPGGCE